MSVRIVWLQKEGEASHAWEEREANNNNNGASDKARAKRAMRLSGKASHSDRTSATKPAALSSSSSTKVRVRKVRKGSKSALADSDNVNATAVDDDDENNNNTNNNNNNNNNTDATTAPPPTHSKSEPAVKLVSFAEIMANMQKKHSTASQDSSTSPAKSSPLAASAPAIVAVDEPPVPVVVAETEQQPAPVVVVQDPVDDVPPVKIVVELHHTDTAVVAEPDPVNAATAAAAPEEAVAAATAAEPEAPVTEATEGTSTTADSTTTTNHRPRRTTLRSVRPDTSEWLVQFVDIDAAVAARDRVVGDDSTAVWCLFTYSTGSTNAIELEATGTNSASLRARFDSRRAQYALLRQTHKANGSPLTKFVAIYWQGAQVGTLAKARSATHKASMRGFFGNVHVDIAARAPADVTDEAIANAVLRGAGQATIGPPRPSPRVMLHTMHREPATAEQKEQKLVALQQLNVSSGGGGGSSSGVRRTVSNSGSSATTVGDGQLAAAIAELQKAEGELELVGSTFASESSGKCWIACGLKGGSIVEVATGASGIAGITKALRERSELAEAAYVFLRARQPSTYGQLQQRTALIEFLSPSVRPVRRARMQPERQRARNMFGHHNVYLEVFNEGDLSTLEEKLVAAMSKH